MVMEHTGCLQVMEVDIVSHHFQLVQEQVKKRQEVVLARRNEIE